MSPIVDNSREACSKRLQKLEEALSENPTATLEYVERPGCLSKLLFPRTNFRHELGMERDPTTAKVSLELIGETVSRVLLAADGQITSFQTKPGFIIDINGFGEIEKVSGPLDSTDFGVKSAAAIGAWLTEQVLQNGNIIVE